MNIEDLSIKLGVSVNANFLQPAPNDLLVLKVDTFLTVRQREFAELNLIPVFKALGCKVVILEGGMDVLLVKQATDVKDAA